MIVGSQILSNTFFSSCFCYLGYGLLLVYIYMCVCKQVRVFYITICCIKDILLCHTIYNPTPQLYSILLLKVKVTHGFGWGFWPGVHYSVDASYQGLCWGAWRLHIIHVSFWQPGKGQTDISHLCKILITLQWDYCLDQKQTEIVAEVGWYNASNF